MQGIGFAIVGSIAKALRIGPFNPEVIRLEEALIERDIAETQERARIRAAIAAIYDNQIGQEGRGAAKFVKGEALAILDREWGPPSG